MAETATHAEVKFPVASVSSTEAHRLSVHESPQVRRPRRRAASVGPCAEHRLSLGGDAVRDARVRRQLRAAPGEEDGAGLLTGHQEGPGIEVAGED